MSERTSHFRPGARRLRRGGRAFTFPELILGMAVTVLCMAAMFAAMSATAAGWRQQGTAQQTYLPNRQALVRVQNLVRGAKLLGYVNEGSLASNTTNAACAVLWASDSAGGTADRAMQYGEIAMLYHDRSDNTIKYYYVNFPSTCSGSDIAAANVAVSYANLTDPTWATNFRTGQIAGITNYVTSKTVATNVSGATFYVNQALGQSSQFPEFEFQISFTRSGTTSTVYGSATLRNPDYKPAS